MAKVILEDVETKGVGFGPIIQYYFESTYSGGKKM